MIETGISIREWLALVAIVLPLLPVLIIAVRKTYRYSVLTWLVVICLLHLVPSFFLAFRLPAATSFYINAFASLARLTAFFLLCRTLSLQRPLKELLGLLFTAFLSIAITVYVLKGVTRSFDDIALAESGIMIAVIALVFVQLLRSPSTFLFDMPVFWIITGSLGYYTMYFITGMVICLSDQPLSAVDEKKWLLLVMEWVRYAFYIIAASIPPEQQTEL